MLWLDGKPGTAHWIALGRSNFIVQAYAPPSIQLVVNEIGPYDGTVILPAETILLEIQATGPWTVEFAR